MAILSTDEIERFWRDGFLVVEGGATPAQLAALNAELDRWIEDSRAHSEN